MVGELRRAAKRATRAPAGLPAGAAPAVLLALIAAAFLAPALLTGGAFIAEDTIGASLPWSTIAPRAASANPLLSDTIAAYLPWRHFFDETLRSGSWPLWNPYILAGHPTFASISEQAFYPLNALAVLLPVEQSFAWLAWIHLSIFGIGTWAFAQLHLRDDASAFLAGCVAMLAGPTVVWLEYPFFLSTLAWTGLLFYFLERTLRERRAWLAVAAGVALGLELLGGQAQYILYVAVLAALYLGGRVASVGAKEGRAALAVLPYGALALIVGLGLGSIAVGPALELVGQVQRSALTLDQLVGSTLPRQNLITFVLPNAFGTPIRRDFVGARNYNEAAVYLGILPLVLVAVLGISAIQARRLTGLVATFASASLLFGLALFGWRPAVAVLGAIPDVPYFVLNRVSAVLPFSVGLLAGAGHAVLPRWRAQRGRLAVGATFVGIAVAGTIVLGGLAESRRPGPAPFAAHDTLVALAFLGVSVVAVGTRLWLSPTSPWRWVGPAIVVADLFSAGWGYNTVTTRDLVGPTPPPPLNAVATGVLAPRTVGISTDRLVLGPNLGMLWDIPTPDGYTSEFLARYAVFADHASPLSLEGIDSSLHLGEDMANLNQAREPYLDLLGVRYVVTSPNPEFADVLHPAGSDASPPVAGAATVGTTFRARQDGLHRIDVYPTFGAKPPGHFIALHLKASPGAAEHLAYVRVNADAIAPGKPLTFYFKPIPDSAGQQFYFYLDAPEATPDDALRLRFAEQSPTPAGALVVDDHPAVGALAFAAYAAPTVNWRLLAEANDTAVFEDANTLPRAFLVSRVQELSDQQFYAGMDDATFDPRQEAAVGEPPPPFAAALLAPAPPRSPGTVTIDGATANDVDLTVTSAAPGLVVVSNAWYPGWQASVDGTVSPDVRVDAIFQGVYVPSGTHRIRLWFAPASLRLGLLLGAGAICLAGIAIGVERYRTVRRRG
jgi:hypothetical protein